jgi:hypothetical protein
MPGERRFQAVMKVVTRDDLEDRTDTLEFWLSRPEYERVEHIQDLREQYEAIRPEAADARREGFRRVLRVVERDRD